MDLAALSAPELTDARRELLGALHAFCTTTPRAQVAATLGLTEAQQGLVDLDAALPTAPTARADLVYSGVLYEALEVASLDSASRRRATSRLAIVSALFGLLRPHDRIPPYRLSGGVTLPGVGGVASFWRRHLGPALQAATGTGLLVDLRSSTYAAFWRPPRALAARTVAVRVLLEQDGRRSVVSHVNKATKGRLARTLLQEPSSPPTPAALATLLRDRRWTVEDSVASGRPLLDVIVDHI